MIQILPQMHPTLRELIQISAKRKWISYEELNTTLPDEMVDPEKLDELLVRITQLGIEFVDQEAVRRNNFEPFQAPLQTNLKFKRDNPNKVSKAPKVRIDHDCDDPASENADAYRHSVSQSRGQAAIARRQR